jgi:hypothetical protein
MRVLHLPTSVGGNAWGLAQGEKALGLDSEVLIGSQNWLSYDADIVLNLQEIHGNVRKFLKLAATFLRVRSRYDVFHFNGGSSLLHSPQNHLDLVDLPFYPRMARLFVTYNGCDARQKFPTIARTAIAACHDPKCFHGLCQYGAYDELRRKTIRKMARYVHHIWALNPDLLYFLPREKSSFLPYSVMPGATDPAVPAFEGRLKLLHAPTNREAKGTRHIVDAVEKVRRERGDVVELLLVENQPHREAVSLYRQADVIVDQVLIGWYGGLAVEAMKLGKPVVARIAEEDLPFLPAEMAKDVLETVINASPSTLHEVILRCVDDRAFLRERAAASLEYANRWHDPKYVATLTRERYEGA